MSAPTKGSVAGQPIKTGAPTKEFDDNFDRIFGKREKPERGSFVWDRRQGKLVPLAEYEAPPPEPTSVPVVSDRYMEGVRAIDGTDIGSRAKRREYMKREGLADASDFAKANSQETKARKQAEQDRQNVREITDTVGRVAYEKRTQKGRR